MTALALFSAGPAAWADGVTLLPDKVSAHSGVRDWRARMDEKGRALIKEGKLDPAGYMECAETAELAGVAMCQSFFQLDLNKTFGRASIFAEGGYVLSKGAIAKHDDPDMLKLNLTTDGHDLKSSDLNTFFGKIHAACAAGNAALCPNPAEEQLYRNVLTPMAKKYKRFVVIGFSYQSFGDYQGDVGHEIMHAQYFMDPRYHDAVTRFWRADVSGEQKRRIREALQAEAYDSHDENLMINEFQAFVLEPGGDEDFLKAFVPPYREKLIAALRKAGAPPIEIQ